MNNIYTIRFNKNDETIKTAATFFISKNYNLIDKTYQNQLNIMQHSIAADETIDFNLSEINYIEIYINNNLIYESDKWINIIGTQLTYDAQKNVFVNQLMFTDVVKNTIDTEINEE